MARGLTQFSPDALRGLRAANSMTAERLARAMGPKVTKAQVLAYENGHRVPDPPRVRALAQALNVHPLQLMKVQQARTWTLADYRRACGLRAQDVVQQLNVSPKNYRRFEAEGIVPTRSPSFVDDVASALDLSRTVVETAIDQTPAVQQRQARAAELVLAMAERYISRIGLWRGPTLDDPNLRELAAAYGRTPQRLRGVLSYELGELRQSDVRSRRERVVADYDTNPLRQVNARIAVDRWSQIYEANLRRIPRRLERFHRTAQPLENWDMLVELFVGDPPSRSDINGVWTVAQLLTGDSKDLSPYLVERRFINDVEVCRLTIAGIDHVQSYSGLYRALYPTARRFPLTGLRGPSSKSRSAGPETFTFPNRPERLTVPLPFLDRMRAELTIPKSAVLVPLSPSHQIAISATHLSAA